MGHIDKFGATDHACIIGLYWCDYGGKLITLDILKAEIERDKEYNEAVEREALRFEALGKPDSAEDWRRVKHKEYSWDSYCDRRKKSPLNQFNYCPECGKKIDWKALRREQQ